MNTSNLSTMEGRDRHKHEKRMFNSMFTFNFKWALKEARKEKVRVKDKLKTITKMACSGGSTLIEPCNPGKSTKLCFK